MATPGYVDVLLNSLDAPLKVAFKQVFDYVLRNLRFGPVVHQARTENFQAYYLTGTTPADANQEFSIAHGLGRVPYVLMPVASLDSVGQALVPLTVSRAADANRIYLTSSSTSAAIAVLVE